MFGSGGFSSVLSSACDAPPAWRIKFGMLRTINRSQQFEDAVNSCRDCCCQIVIALRTHFRVRSLCHAYEWSSRRSKDVVHQPQVSTQERRAKVVHVRQSHPCTRTIQCVDHRRSLPQGTTAVTESPPINYDFKMSAKRRLRFTAWLSCLPTR